MSEEAAAMAASFVFRYTEIGTPNRRCSYAGKGMLRYAW
jgi:hypothetical protein